jgi:hypothetical protein
LVTHSPPRDVNDRDDMAHRGFKALRSFLTWFRPAYQLHGHVHLYDRSKPYSQRFEATDVINVFPYRVVEVQPALAPTPAPAPKPSSAPAPMAASAIERLPLAAERRPVSGRHA